MERSQDVASKKEQRRKERTENGGGRAQFVSDLQSAVFRRKITEVCPFQFRIGLPNPSRCIWREVLSVSVRDIEHLTLSTKGVSWQVLLCGPHEQTKKGVSAFAFLTCPCWPVPDTGSSNLLEQCRLCGR